MKPSSNAVTTIDLNVGPGLSVSFFGSSFDWATIDTLFLHGYLDCAGSFEDLIDRANFRERALALDWRGHGESQWVGPGGSYHLLDHLKDLSGTLEYLQTQGCTIRNVVAHSMGGNVALLFAGLRSSKLRHLILLDILGPPSEDSLAQIKRLQDLLDSHTKPKRWISVRDREALIERLCQHNPKLSKAGACRMARYALKPIEEKGESRFNFKMDPRLRGPTPMRYPEPFYEALFTNIEARIFFVGAEHGYIPSAFVKKRAKYFRSFQESWINATGHHVHVDAHEELGELLQSFLSGSFDDNG